MVGPRSAATINVMKLEILFCGWELARSGSSIASSTNFGLKVGFCTQSSHELQQEVAKVATRGIETCAAVLAVLNVIHAHNRAMEEIE